MPRVRRDDLRARWSRLLCDGQEGRGIAQVGLVASCVILSVACGEPAPSAPPQCVPGSVVSCPCAAATPGAQTCQADGTFSPCACASPEVAQPAAAIDVTNKDDPDEQWSALIAPWSRIHFDAAGDEGYQFTTVDSATWSPPGAPSVRLTVVAHRQIRGGGDIAMASARDQMEVVYRLMGAWDGQRPATLATFSIFGNGEMMGEELLASGSGTTVVYAGQREDGAALISLEELPASAARNPGGGRVKRILLRWNAAEGRPEAVRVWEGGTRHVPANLRARQ